jgi:hypothetical protein
VVFSEHSRRGREQGYEEVTMRTSMWLLAAVLMMCPVRAALQQPEKPAPEKAAAGGDITIKGDTNKRYFLNMPSGTAPAGGVQVAHRAAGRGWVRGVPAVREQHGQAGRCRPGYIVAQAVAPAWSKSEDRVVWPTEKLKGTPAPKFTTEQFVEEIIADVKAKHAIDAKFVYMLGWSSGGPPCYSMALKQGSR